MRQNRHGINLCHVNRTDRLLPIYSPRTSYKMLRESDQKMLGDITFNFDRATINELRVEFERRGWKMVLPQFVCVVKQHLTNWQPLLPNRDAKLTRCLNMLFKDIDINENGDLQWEEFTNYVIQKATSLKNLKCKGEELKAYSRSPVTPKGKFDATIHKCIFLSDIQRLAMFEEGSNVVKFVNPENGEFSPKELKVDGKRNVVILTTVVRKATVGFGGGPPRKHSPPKTEIQKKQLDVTTQSRLLDILYIPQEKYRLLLTSTSDGVVRGWKSTTNGFILAEQPQNLQELMQHQFADEVYSMTWDSLNQILYCGLKDGTISMWNLKTDTEQSMEPVNQKESHNSFIMDMVSMPKLQFLASAGIDSKLILWDTISYKVKWTYREHTRGILTLSFNESLILLFSGGFDHQICIWNPYIPTLIHKIQGHLAPILTIKVVESTNQVVSLDSAGNVRISDKRRFNHLGGFNLTEEGGSQSPNCLCVLPKPLKLVVAGRGLTFYNYDKNYNPYTVDDCVAITCRYLQDSLVFLTPVGGKVKVWNALSGDVDKIFLSLTPNEISAFALDPLERRMVIGDSKGSLSIFNASNGAKMKLLPQHSGQVTRILTGKIGQSFLFVSFASDNQFHLIREMPESNEDSYKIIQLKKQLLISYCVLSPNSLTLLVITNQGQLMMYETETGKLIGSSGNSLDFNQQAVSLEYIGEQEVIICGSGGLMMVAGLPLPEKFQRLLTKQHTDDRGRKLVVNTALIAVDIKKYFIVDERGMLCCYDISNLIHESSNSQMPQFNSSFYKINKGNSQRSIFNGAQISLMWISKFLLPQNLKKVDYHVKESLISACTYDKRVIFWSANDGKMIDSLQQNYDKRDAVPVGYRQAVGRQIFDESMKNSVGELTEKQKKLLQEQFNPVNQPKTFQQKISNYEWNLHINFQNHYEGVREQLVQLDRQIGKYKQQQLERLPLQNITNRTKSKLDTSRVNSNCYILQQLRQCKMEQQQMGISMQSLTQRMKEKGWPGDTTTCLPTGGITTRNDTSMFSPSRLMSHLPTDRKVEDSSFRREHEILPTVTARQTASPPVSSQLAKSNVKSSTSLRFTNNQRRIFSNIKILRETSVEEKKKIQQQHQSYIRRLSRSTIKHRLMVRIADRLALNYNDINNAYRLNQAIQDVDYCRGDCAGLQGQEEVEKQERTRWRKMKAKRW